MSTHALTILAFGMAAALTIAGIQQVWLHQWVPPQKVAVWFPLLLILPLPGEFVRFFLSLVQFPLIATVFSIGIRRWKAIPTLCLILFCYALCMAVAFILIESH